MNFVFTNSTGTILDSEVYKDNIEKLLNGDTVTLYIRNVDATDTPGLYLKKSTSLGEVDFPSNQSPASDRNDLLFWGSQSPPAGLYVVKDNVNTYFNYTAGSGPNNRIQLTELANLNANGITSISIGYTAKTGVSSRRLYIGLEVYDSNTTI